jgi:hypothetical protein
MTKEGTFDSVHDPALLGVVQLRIRGHLFALPVKAMSFGEGNADADGTPEKGGFFADGEELGILVDSRSSQADVQRSIETACQDAVRHLSLRYAN